MVGVSEKAVAAPGGRLPRIVGSTACGRPGRAPGARTGQPCCSQSNSASVKPALRRADALKGGLRRGASYCRTRVP